MQKNKHLTVPHNTPDSSEPVVAKSLPELPPPSSERRAWWSILFADSVGDIITWICAPIAAIAGVLMAFSVIPTPLPGIIIIFASVVLYLIRGFQKLYQEYVSQTRTGREAATRAVYYENQHSQLLAKCIDILQKEAPFLASSRIEDLVNGLRMAVQSAVEGRRIITEEDSGRLRPVGIFFCDSGPIAVVRFKGNRSREFPPRFKIMQTLKFSDTETDVQVGWGTINDIRDDGVAQILIADYEGMDSIWSDLKAQQKKTGGVPHEGYCILVAEDQFTDISTEDLTTCARLLLNNNIRKYFFSAAISLAASRIQETINGQRQDSKNTE
jgi:hypothetical protein